jgi:dolichol-phosphate mannosyltransferase
MEISPPQLGIVAPVFNEGGCISEVIDSWIFALEDGIMASLWNSYEIVLCDDGSTDDTLQLIEEKIRNNPNIKVVRNAINSGAGVSLARAVANTTCRYIVLMDSDGQFNPKQIARMYQNLSTWDAVCGIRAKNSSFSHNIASRLSTKYANFLFKSNVKDFNCQFKIVPGDFLRSVHLRSVQMNYSGEITWAILKSNLSTIWIDVAHNERLTGKSKTKLLRDGISRFQFLTYLGFEKRLVDKKVIHVDSITGCGK